MNRSSFVAAMLLTSFVSASVVAQTPKEEAVTIPLDQIWGYNLPGTRDVAGIPLPKGLEAAEFARQRDADIELMRRSLMVKPPAEAALPGFAVSGQPDFTTLRGIKSQLATDAQLGVKGRLYRPKNSFPASDSLTLVFFSHPTSYYIVLRSVERSDKTITVNYEFQPQSSPNVTVHFALIPLGKLSAGEYRVEYKGAPVDQKYLLAGFKPINDASKLVCLPFTFTVFEPPVEEHVPEGAKVVPLEQIWAYDMPDTKDIRKLDAAISGGITRHPIVESIRDSLRKIPKEGEKAGPAFVVAGTDARALAMTDDILAKRMEASSTFKTNEELTLTFFSFQNGGRYVHLDSVQWSGNTIIVRYRFLSHMTTEASSHFALIPLGTLDEGTYHVEVKQLPPVSQDGRKPSFFPEPDRYVCGSSSFQVGK